MDNPISRDWSIFEGSLAACLAVLVEDQYLVITAKRSGAYVQFAAQGAWGLRAETVSENYLPPEEDLDAVQSATLVVLGWSEPTGSPEWATPQNQPAGSPNHFRDFASPVQHAEVSRLAVRTFREVWRIPHPGYLSYSAFDADNRIILLPTLGLMQRVRP